MRGESADPTLDLDQVVFNTEAHPLRKIEKHRGLRPSKESSVGMGRENLGQKENLGLTESMGAQRIDYVIS